MQDLFASLEDIPKRQRVRNVHPTFPPLIIPQHLAIMDSASVKQAVMQQVSSEANMANVRLLIEVGSPTTRNLAKQTD